MPRPKQVTRRVAQNPTREQRDALQRNALGKMSKAGMATPYIFGTSSRTVVDRPFASIHKLVESVPLLPKEIESYELEKICQLVVQKANDLLSRIYLVEQVNASDPLAVAFDKISKKGIADMQDTFDSIKEILDIIKKNGGLKECRDVKKSVAADWKHFDAIIDAIEEELLTKKDRYSLRIDSDELLEEIGQITKKEIQEDALVCLDDILSGKNIENQLIIASRRYKYHKSESVSNLVDLALNLYDAMVRRPNLLASPENLGRTANFVINTLFIICELRKERPDNLQEFTPNDEQKERIANLFAVVLCNKIDNPEYKKSPNLFMQLADYYFPKF